MFQTFISRHNSNFFSDKLVLTSVTPASSAPVLQTPKATSSTLYFRSEERFSRNAETDLVCRLLLEKKKIKTVSFSNKSMRTLQDRTDADHPLLHNRAACQHAIRI